jgi:hypothetical protein
MLDLMAHFAFVGRFPDSLSGTSVRDFLGRTNSFGHRFSPLQLVRFSVRS